MSDEQAPMSSDYRPFLSVIIPAYDEELRIVDTLKQVVNYLELQSYTWEVAVVDDGSTDSTASLVTSFAESRAHVRLISISHGGKGWAVNNGMLSTMGEYRFLCDADLSMPVEQLSRFFPPKFPTSTLQLARERRPVRVVSGSHTDAISWAACITY